MFSIKAKLGPIEEFLPCDFLRRADGISLVRRCRVAERVWYRGKMDGVLVCMVVKRDRCGGCLRRSAEGSLVAHCSSQRVKALSHSFSSISCKKVGFACASFLGTNQPKPLHPSSSCSFLISAALNRLQLFSISRRSKMDFIINVS